jgi:hypothetical protein
VPTNLAGKLKVVGVLDGWPFPLREAPTELDPRALKPAAGSDDLFRPEPPPAKSRQ